MPTRMIRWRLRSRDAHCDPKLAEAGSLGPAVPTAIRSWRRGLARSLAMRIGEEVGEEDWRGGGRGEGGEEQL